MEFLTDYIIVIELMNTTLYMGKCKSVLIIEKHFDPISLKNKGMDKCSLLFAEVATIAVIVMCHSSNLNLQSVSVVHDSLNATSISHYEIMLHLEKTLNETILNIYTKYYNCRP